MENKHKYFYNIDFLRFLFAITIIIFHCSTKNYIYKFFSNVDWFSKFNINASCGTLCVDMFFIVSGFFLFYTLKEISTVDFIKNKLIRLYPLIVIYSIFHIIMMIFAFKVPNYMPYEELYRLLLIDNIGFNMKGTGLTWFVSVLFWVHLLYFYSYKNLNKKLFNLLNCIFVLFCFGFILHVLNGRIGGHFQYYFYIFNIGVMRGIAGVGTGYLLYLLYNSLSVYENTKFRSLIATVLECSLMYFIFYHLIFHKLPYTDMILIIAFCALFLLFTLQYGLLSKFLNNNFSKILGKYSYSIFLTHIFVLDMFKIYLYKLHPNLITTYGYLNIAFIVGCSIVVGVLVHHLFEVPAVNFLKNIKTTMGGGN